MVSRSYRSPRRADSTAKTRSAILAAASDLFQARGYSGAAVAEIAEAAGVSVNTIYASVGNKPQVLIALIEAAAGSEVIDETMERIEAENTLLGMLTVVAGGTRAVFEANAWVLGALYDNAATDPRFIDVVRQSEANYKTRLLAMAERLTALGLARDALRTKDVSDVLWFYFGFRPWRELRDLGWSWDRSGQWLAVQAAAAIA